MVTAESNRKLPTPMLFDEISNFWEEIAEASSTEYQTKLVTNNIEKNSLLLDFCCGSGRHSIRLREKGYNVVGLDISSRLLRIAKLKAAKANVDLQLVRADTRFVPFKPEVFTAVLSLDASFGYLSSYEEDVQSLNEVWRILKYKSLFLLDLFNRDRLDQQYRKRFTPNFWRNIRASLLRFPRLSRFFRWKEYTSFFLQQERQLTKDGNLVETWFFRDKKTKQIMSYQHAMRLYSLPQVRAILEKACLTIIKSYGNYEEQEYSKNSSRFIVIAEKVG